MVKIFCRSQILRMKTSEFCSKCRQPKISGPWRFIDITDIFTCVYTNAKMTKMLPIPFARHFNLPNHSTHGMTIFGLFFTKETQKAVKTSNKKFSLNWTHQTIMHGINERLSFTHNPKCLYSFWRMDNSGKVSFVITLQGKFDAYQLVCCQIFAFHFTADTTL